MIPVKLELKNFLSYGDQVSKIDFQGHNLICLSGKNGNGKSALLDAITWVLWGRARKTTGTSKADAGLIRLGQTRMVVSLEFLSNGQRYRVYREFAKTYGKPISVLDFQMFDVEGNFFRSLTEKTTRMTQEKIEKTVGIDFNTFINSAFLRQGQSNEFSQKTPKERKQILAKILGLSQYDELSKISLDHARKKNQEESLLKKIEEQVLLELEQENILFEDLKKQKDDFFVVEKKLKDHKKKIEDIEKKRIFFLEQKYKHEQLCKEKENLSKTIKKREGDLLDDFYLWRKIHKLSLSIVDIKKLEKDKQDFYEQEKSFRDKQLREMALQEKIILLKQEIQKTSFELEKRLDKELSEKKMFLQKKEFEKKQCSDDVVKKKEFLSANEKKRKELHATLEGFSKELKKTDAFEKDFLKQKDQFEKRRVFYQTLVQKGNWAQKELGELGRKKEVVHDKQNPSCPLCEQMLSAKRKQFLAKTFVVHEKFLGYRLEKIKKLLKKLKAILFEQHKQIQKNMFVHDRYQQLRANKENFEKNLAELKAEYDRESVAYNLLLVQEKQAEKDLKKLESDLKKIVEKSPSKEDKFFGVLLEHEKKLRKLEDEKVAVKYDKKEHEKISKKLSECEKKLEDFFELIDGSSSNSQSGERRLDQIDQQEMRKKSIERIIVELKDLKKQFFDLCKKLEAVKKACEIDSEKEKVFDEKIRQVDVGIVELKKEESVLLREKETLLQKKGSLENKKTRFSQLKKEQKDRKKEIEKISEEASEYQMLSHMFGKDGIQALLIEQAIPEIEQEANALLSSLTDNRAQIFIESLRDLKKGGVKESLDIHISDPSGIRPYEMFSGGEAFRIDFALRIAISKLLARRAGTALQTLIIDEGFGSQDEDGLQRLMDAIYAIQKDFVKIIVVSHLPIFKNNFPVHFIVEKNSLGSSIRVEERG